MMRHVTSSITDRLDIRILNQRLRIEVRQAIKSKQFKTIPTHTTIEAFSVIAVTCYEYLYRTL